MCQAVSKIATIMATQGDSVAEIPESSVDDSSRLEKQSSDMASEANENIVKENGAVDDHWLSNDNHDQLLEIIMELKLQNDFLKSQFEGLKSLQLEHGTGMESRQNVDVKELHDRIESLNKELQVEKQTRGAAEKALEHLRTSYEEADAKAQEFSAKLAEGQISISYSLYTMS